MWWLVLAVYLLIAYLPFGVLWSRKHHVWDYEKQGVSYEGTALVWLFSPLSMPFVLVWCGLRIIGWAVVGSKTQ